jgi:hypothetical protein
MSNANAPFGGRLINTLVAASFNSKLHTYTTSSSDATPIFVGDFVRMTNVTDVYGTPYITQANATDLDIVGVVISMKNSITQEPRIYRAANEILDIQVIDDPLAEFEIQVNGIVSTTSIGKSANLIVGAGSTLSGMSGMQINVSTIGSGSQMLIIGMLARSDNTLGAYTKVRATILAHKFLNRSAGSVSIPVTNTLYVDGNRVDSYAADGSMLYPFKTVQTAVDKASSTIYTETVVIDIAPGTYIENVIFNSANLRKIHLKGDAISSTIISPGFGDALKCITNNTAFTDLVISNIKFLDPVTMTGTSNFMSGGLVFDSCYLNSTLSCNHSTLVNSTSTYFGGAVTLTNAITAQFFTGFFQGHVNTSTNVVMYANECEFSGSTITIADNTCYSYLRNNIITYAVSNSGALDSFYNRYLALLTLTATATLSSSGDIFSKGIATTSGAVVNIQDLASSVSHDVTAHAGGGQASATHAYGKIVNITTAASPGDSILLDNAYLNAWVIVKNQTSNSVNVYCQVDEFMNGVQDAASAVTGGHTALFYSYENGKWRNMGALS